MRLAAPMGSAIPKMIEREIAPLRERIAALEAEVAGLRSRPSGLRALLADIRAGDRNGKR